MSPIKKDCRKRFLNTVKPLTKYCGFRTGDGLNKKKCRERVKPHLFQNFGA